MGAWDDFKKFGKKAMNISTLGVSGAVEDSFSQDQVKTPDIDETKFQRAGGDPTQTADIREHGLRSEAADARQTGAATQEQFTALGGKLNAQGAAGNVRGQQTANEQRAEGAAAQADSRRVAAGFIDQADDARARTAPELQVGDARFAAAQANQARGQQFDALGGVRAQTAQGPQTGDLQAFRQAPAGPTAAEAQLQQGSERAMGSALSLARSGRNGVNAAAERQAMFQNAATGAETSQQAAMLRAQEAQARRGQDLQALSVEEQARQAARGQNIQALSLEQQSLINTRAQDLQAQGLSMDEAKFRATTELQTRQQNDAAALGYSGLATGELARGDTTRLGFEGVANDSVASGQQFEVGKNNAANAAMGTGVQAGLGFGELGLSYENAAEGVTQAERNAAMQAEAMRTGNIMTANAANANFDTQRDAANLGFFQSIAGAAAGVRSDIRAKKDIKSRDNVAAALGMAAGKGAHEAGRKVGRFDVGYKTSPEFEDPYGLETPPLEGYDDPYGLDSLVTSDKRVKTDLRPAKGFSYRYKDPERHGEGEFTGPMAQDLEKSPATRGAVFEDSDGTKSVDTGRLTLVNTSAIGEQQRRQDELERRVAQFEALGGKKRPKAGAA